MPAPAGSAALDTPAWALPLDRLSARVGSSDRGLTSDEVRARSRAAASRALRPSGRAPVLRLLLGQFTNPVTLILIGAALLSLFIGGATDSVLIGSIVLVSALLGFFQEHAAKRAVARLLARVEVRARVVRDGTEREVPLAEVVPGDLLLVGCGDLIPADCRLIEARDLSVDESSLTGESFPADKRVGLVAVDAPLAARSNTLYCGSHVVAGSARAIVYAIGQDTLFGHVAERLRARVPETDFERGVRRFGMLLLELTLVLVLAIFAVNVYLARPVLESLLFAVALAVGLTPQLLPAIISVNLAKGARRMAEQRVVVKRLAAIENFGSMTVLCTDKTGTLTEPKVELVASVDGTGAASNRARQFAAINAALHAGFRNPIDDALSANAPAAVKIDEVPYDFSRKRQSVLVDLAGERWLITKGAVDPVLAVCPQVDREAVAARARAFGVEGKRTLAVAARRAEGVREVAVQDERDLEFIGLLAFAAPLKRDLAATLTRLGALGVRLKILTGDSRHVSAAVARQLGMATRVVTGVELDQASSAALPRLASDADVFAELEPRHKERIVRALRRDGEVVGVLGDGINDAPALHAADVGITVDNAVDVAKDAADIVLLDHDLGVLVNGIEGGRHTFANTLKYVYMATSANFGNMFSMAGASLFLPFLPLLPKQVLLTNLLTDLPEMTIGGDRVDPEMVARPRRWDIAAIRRFMLVFGLLSSVFDYVTFIVLRWGLHTAPPVFRAGWFIESVLSASLIVLVIRSRRPLGRSTPSRWLVATTAAVVVGTVALPFSPLGPLFGFGALPLLLLAIVAAIVVTYVAGAELTKRIFFRQARRAR